MGGMCNTTERQDMHIKYQAGEEKRNMKHKSRWKNNIKINPKEVLCEEVKWNKIAQKRVK